MMTTKELVASYRIWKIVVSANLPPEKAAEACMEQQPKFRAEWNIVRHKIMAGERLSEVMTGLKLWPDDALFSVKAGEASRQLGEVFTQLMEMTEETDTIKKTARKKLIAPFLYIVIGQMLFFSFFIKLYPSLTVQSKRRDGIIAIMDSIQSVVIDLAAPMGFLLVSFVMSLLVLSRLPVHKDRLLGFLDGLPQWGDGQRAIAVASWSKIFALLDNTGTIHDEESIKIATSVLDKRYQKPFQLLMRDYQRKGSLAEAANKDKWSPVDPRQEWPIIFTSALSAGAMAGGTGSILKDVANGMMEEGKIMSYAALDKFNIIGMAIAGLSIGSVMLLMAMSSLAQTISAL